MIGIPKEIQEYIERAEVKANRSAIPDYQIVATELRRILADERMSPVFERIKITLQTEDDYHRRVACEGFCRLLAFKAGELPKESRAQRIARQEMLKRKIKDLLHELREEVRLTRGGRLSTANAIRELEHARSEIDHGPLFQYESPYLPQRKIEESKVNVFYCHVADWFTQWSGKPHHELVKTAVEVAMQLDTDGNETETARRYYNRSLRT